MNHMEEIPIQMVSTSQTPVISTPPSQQEVNATESDSMTSPASSHPPDFNFLNDWSWQQQQQQHPSQDQMDDDTDEQESPSIPTLAVIRQPEEQHRARYLSVCLI